VSQPFSYLQWFHISAVNLISRRMLQASRARSRYPGLASGLCNAPHTGVVYGSSVLLSRAQGGSRWAMTSYLHARLQSHTWGCSCSGLVWVSFDAIPLSRTGGSSTSPPIGSVSCITFSVLLEVDVGCSRRPHGMVAVAIHRTAHPLTCTNATHQHSGSVHALSAEHGPFCSHSTANLSR